MKKEINITTISLRTIAIEKATIAALKSSIDKEYCAGVQAIFETNGRVVLTGIGKSALIAKKIVATLNSTGTPSIFMHAADAIHGDLGMIQTDDIIICLSKSGETAEIKVLVPLLKNLGSKLIGIVANRNSYLARHADFVFHTPVGEEADPNNLAPTSSTTAQLVLGDAIATSLLAMRGFSPRDFAQFHPGGALGKQLYLRVHDLYPNHEKPAVLPTATLRQVIIEMTSKRLGATAVINDKEEVLGVITDGDLRRMLESSEEVTSLSANDIMTTSPKSINHNELAVKALSIMRTYSITQLIVVDGKKYLGMVHLHDLIKEGLV